MNTRPDGRPCAPLMSFAMTWKAFVDGTKTVTRRSRLVNGVWLPGQPRLEVGSLFEGVEWSPRVGARWVCRECGWQGPISPETMAEAEEHAHGTRQRTAAAHAVIEHHAELHLDCDLFSLYEYRKPTRLPGLAGYRRVVSVRPEWLEELDYLEFLSPAKFAKEMSREGCPGMSARDFATMYCGVEPDWKRPVNRIEFERCEP